MTTLTIDIMNDKALNLIKDLEALNIIHVRKNKKIDSAPKIDFTKKYKGAIPAQPLEEVDRQLDELRNSWE